MNLLDLLFFVLIFVFFYIPIGAYLIYSIYHKKIKIQLSHDVHFIGLLFTWPIVIPVTLFYYALSKAFRIKNTDYITKYLKTIFT